MGLGRKRHRELDCSEMRVPVVSIPGPISANFYQCLGKIEDFLGAYPRYLLWQSGAKATQPDPLLGHGFCCPKAQFQKISGEFLVAAT